MCKIPSLYVIRRKRDLARYIFLIMLVQPYPSMRCAWRSLAPACPLLSISKYYRIIQIGIEWYQMAPNGAQWGQNIQMTFAIHSGYIRDTFRNFWINFYTFVRHSGDI